MGKTTELFSLLKTGNSDAARKLIAKLKKSGKKKALAKELNTQDDNGQTVVHCCAAQNFVEFLKDLTELGASFEIADDKGYTPLHLASGAGRTGAVTVLLGQGADPNIASRSGDTPLHLACQNGYAQAVEVLISENANCTMLNVSGHTPLDLACQNGHPQVVSLLLRSGQFSQSYLQRSDMPHTALLLAAKHGHNEVVGLLVKYGFDVNRKLPGANGSCLHEAALYGRVDTVRYLLQCGADVSMVNAQGLTALDIVNMYTDPRSAGQMKLVLQEALAQQARVRMAQQQQHYQQKGGHPHHMDPRAGHPHHMDPRGGQSHHMDPRAGHPHHMDPRGGQSHHMDPRAGQSHHMDPRGGQAHHMDQRRAQAHHMDQRGGHPHHMDPRAGQSHHMPLQDQRGAQFLPHQHPSQGSQQRAPSQALPPQQQAHSGQSSPARPKTQGFSYILPPQHSLDQRAHSTGQQRTYSTGQQRTYNTGQQQAHSTGPQRTYSTGQQHTYSTGQQPPAQVQYPQALLQHSEQHIPHPEAQSDEQPSVFAQQLQQRKQQLQQQQQQQPHPQTGEYHAPDTAKRGGVGLGAPSGLAAEIAARAASRKPMMSSPTKKEFEDPRFSRSATVSSTDSSVGEARQAVLRRRNSLTERSSKSPEREASYNPPTLPRRTHGGPPAFKPVPPPAEGEQRPAFSNKRFSNERSPSPDVEKPRPLKKVAKPPPPAPTSSVDNELLQKLRRRQDQIEQAELAPAEEEGPAEEEPQLPPEPEAPPPQSKPSNPPPKPERGVSTVPSQETGKAVVAEKTEKSEPPPPQPKPKPKPPPPAPKGSGLTPWQEEVMKRKLKKATSESEVLASSQPPPDQLPPCSEPSPPQPPETSPPKPPETSPPKPSEPSPPKPSETSPPKPPEPSPPKRIEISPPPLEDAVIPPPMAFAPPPSDLPPPPKETPLPMTQVSDLRFPLGAIEPEEERKEEAKTAAPSTPTSDHLSRSTSQSSLTTIGTVSPLHHSEPLRIADWLALYKLQDYVPLFEANGYDHTDVLVGISQEELVELGVQKVGHRKKILAALTNITARDHLFSTKPTSISEWLSLLGLAQYEPVLLDAGYDDIDFISDITADELRDINITKKGHLKQFMRGISELARLASSEPSIPPPLESLTNGPSSVPPNKQQEAAGLLTAPQQLPVPNPKRASQEESILLQNGGGHPRTDSDQPPRPRQDSTGQTTFSSGSLRAKNLVEQQRGTSRSTESLEHSDNDSAEALKAGSRSPSASPQVQRKVKGGLPPPIPRRAVGTSLSTGRQELGVNRHSLSSSTSSLSSNYSERTTGSYDIRASGEVQPSTLAALQGMHPEMQQSPPKRSQRLVPPTQHAAASGAQGGGQNFTDSGRMSYHMEDLTSALDTTLQENDELESAEIREEEGGRQQQAGGSDELDELTRALQGFEPETGQSNKPPQEPQTDQLLADIDDMLADLSTHLDFMIPGSS